MSMYGALVPVAKNMLNAMSGVLGKGAAHAEANKIDPATLIGWRLAPDMLALNRQIYIATDTVRLGAARLAGLELPSVPDTEMTFAELQARIASTIAYLDGLKPEQFDGSEDREVVLKMRSGDLTFTGQNYLVQFVIPNFTFHCATAYNILRQAGVSIGKKDFLGAP